MNAKSILFTAPGRAELVEEAVPRPGAHEALVRVHRSSISSGTERANLTGELNISITAYFTEAHFPRRGGYSAAGEVVEVGEGVTGLKPGDRVVISCGCHTEYEVMNERNLIKIEDGRVTDQAAALTRIGVFPLAAIRKCHLEIGESAIVMGQGVLGLIAVQLLRAAGAAPVIAVDPVPEKRALALKQGADYALDPFAPDFAEQVKSLTGGGVHVAVEVTGSGRALDQALDCMARLGRVALLGCTRHSDFTIDYYHKVHGPGISLIGAHNNARPEYESAPALWTERDDIAALLRLNAGGRIDLGSLVQEVHAPEDAPEVYTRLATEKSFPVVQFDWGKDA